VEGAEPINEEQEEKWDYATTHHDFLAMGHGVVLLVVDKCRVLKEEGRQAKGLLVKDNADGKRAADGFYTTGQVPLIIIIARCSRTGAASTRLSRGTHFSRYFSPKKRKKRVSRLADISLFLHLSTLPGHTLGDKTVNIFGVRSYVYFFLSE
jgi:hypothetical protein